MLRLREQAIHYTRFRGTERIRRQLARAEDSLDTDNRELGAEEKVSAAKATELTVFGIATSDKASVQN